ncbi:hypothetical protein SOPP22_14195 [Shewanella sp. OPT22]|nr:hypothetical protein SOPP22_14195 [Shewanella sp. OPT22]
MNKIKLIGVFFLGVLLGLFIAIFLYSKHYQDEVLADEISHLYLPVKEFVSYAELSDKQVFCINLNDSISSVKYLKTLLSNAKDRYIYSSTLDIVSNYAIETIEEFENMPNDKIKYDCKKT